MARITYGIGTSHGPLLRLPPEQWDVRAKFDRAQTELAYRDGTYSFAELCEHRKDDRSFFEGQNKLEVRTERHARCQKQLATLLFCAKCGLCAPAASTWRRSQSVAPGLHTSWVTMPDAKPSRRAGWFRPSPDN